MGSLQKKEMEVSCKMKKEEMHTLQKHNCQAFKLLDIGRSSTGKGSSYSTLSLSQDKCNQSVGTLQVHTTSKEGNINPSHTPKQLIKLSSSYTKLDRHFSIDVWDERFHAFGGHTDVPFSENSAEILDPRCMDAEPVHLGFTKKTASKSRILKASKNASLSGYFGHTNNKDQYLLESVRGQELALQNMNLHAPISLSDISGKNNLLNLINYFPEKPSSFYSSKKLLILDINGILADIVYPPPKGYKADAKIAGRAVFTRPFCSDFLSFCLERFNVAIWSSRSRKIIDRLIKYLMGDMKHKLIFCWDLSHCTQSNFRTLENKHKTLVFKELRKVWETHDPAFPWEKGYFNESNTLLLDDTPYKALLNPPHSAIFPYSFDFKDRADIALGPRGNIRAYLEEIAMSDDVQKYIKQHPFGQSAITERSLSWRFYYKVIQGHSALASRT